MKTWGDRATATNKDYEGETINTNLVIQGGQKHFETQYFPRRVWHDTQGKPAFIIGNGQSRQEFDLKSLRGKGTTYGCNAVYRDFTPDYLVSLDRNISQEIADTYIGTFASTKMSKCSLSFPVPKPTKLSKTGFLIKLTASAFKKT